MDDHNLNSAVLGDLSSIMECGIFTNPQGEILVIHDQELERQVDYVQYDSSNDNFCIIYDDGKMQSLGLEFDQKIHSNLKHGVEVYLAYMKDKVIQSSQKVVFLIQSY